MTKSVSTKKKDLVADSRKEWLAAIDRVAKLRADMYRPGNGYGDPEARFADEHKLQSAREEADQLFRQYYDLDRQRVESEMLKLQRSQRLATWASFAVAALVGAATIINTFFTIPK